MEGIVWIDLGVKCMGVKCGESKGADGSLMIPPFVRDIFGVSLDEKCGQRLKE
jgi:hypothetical protein